MADLLAGRMALEETRAVEGHLAACSVCRRRVDDAELQNTRVERPARSAPTGAADDEHDRPASDTLGERYRLLGLLGSGAMGRVYKAHDLELGEVVALKVLRTSLVDAPGMLDRFRREARLARHVTHRNVVRTFDIGQHEGAWFLTMELVDGESLAALLTRESQLSVARTLTIAREICEGLTAAHEAGVVHRDLKPGNVLLARDGRILISDFGIAIAPTDSTDASLTSGGFVLGTPTYMAPEQVEAGGEVDARADLYAFGAMLFEMLTGEPPWRGASPMAVAAARLLSPPPDPCERDPAVPMAVGRAVMRCMARKPSDRYATARELAAVLGGSPGDDGERPAVSKTGHPVPAGQPFGSVVPGIKTLTVLPFRNGGPPEEAYIAEGLSEDLVDILSMTPGLRVRATAATRRADEPERDPREIGQDLGVQVVVDGSVRRSGASVRIAVRLVAVSDGFQLWAQRFDRAPEDLLVVSDEIARAVAEALESKVPAPPRRVPPDPEAIDLYLRARRQYHLRWAPGAVPRAVALYAQALARAPDDPTLLSGYSMALVRLGWQVAPDPALRTRASEVCERAVALAPQLAEPRLALGSIALNAGNLAGAARQLLLAIAKNPSLAEAHELLGTLLTEAGAIPEGIAYLEAATAFDPDSDTPWVWLSRVHSLLGDEVAARACRDQVCAPSSLSILAVGVARVALWNRDPTVAAETLARLPAEVGVTGLARGLLAAIAAGAGALPPDADSFLAGMTNPGAEPRRRALGHQLRAELAGARGDTETVLLHLEAAADAGLMDLPWLDRCPLFEDLRAEPRFATVRKRAGAVARGVLDAFRNV